MIYLSDTNEPAHGSIDDADQEENEHQGKPLIRHEESNFVPKYAGAINAFSIQLFCIEEKYESRSLDFLPKAFECFPDKDYCIITVPHTVPEFALIQNFFVCLTMF